MRPANEGVIHSVQNRLEMDLSDELLEQIGTYLAGQLPAGEKAQFEDRLQQDPALRHEVAIQRELKQGLSFLAQKDRFKQMHAHLDKRGLLTQMTRQAEQPATPEPHPTKPEIVAFPESQPVRPAFHFGRASWVMAASLVLLLGIGWLVYSNQRRTVAREELARNERVFNRFYSTNPKLGPSLPPDPDRLAASPDNNLSAADSVRLYGAISGLGRADSQPVINELRTLSTNKAGRWSATAQWYLSLAYLKNNQRAEAQLILQKIAVLKGHPYQQEARQLLAQLPASPSAP